MGEVLESLLENFFSLGEDGYITQEFEFTLYMRSDYVPEINFPYY